MLTTEHIERITSISKQIAPDGGLHNPNLGDDERDYLCACVDNNEVSSIGAFVLQFEKALEKYTVAKHAVPIVNGTTALALALRLVGVRPGDIVVTQPLTFVGTCNAIAMVGAIPAFCDVDQETGCMDFDSLRELCSAERITPAAIVPVHVQGIPGDLEDICEAADHWSCPVVEDAAEALGSWRNGVHCGLKGDVGILSFNGNKTITTGGGGAILTNNTRLAEHARHLSTQAKMPHKWEYEHDEVAGNSRMPNINAALGCAQMDRIGHILNSKESNFAKYQSVFIDAGCDYLHSRGDSVWNYWLVTLLAADVSDRDRLLAEFGSRGVKARPLWKLLNEYGPYKQCISTETPNARWLYERAVALPSGVR